MGPVPELVSVATYNLYLGADLSLILGERPSSDLDPQVAEVQRQLLATSFPDRAEHIAGTLVEREVDLVGLQEVCCWTLAHEQLWDFTVLLLDALRRRGADYEVVSEVATFSGEGELSGPDAVLPIDLRGSNVVLRRADSRVRVLEEAHGVFSEALETISLGDHRIAIARGWCGVHCQVGEQRFAFVDTHTEAYDAGSRDRQRDEVLTACRRWGDPVVLVGDFNATPDRVAMPSGLVDAWSVNGDDPGPTCCQAADLGNEESWLSERIDYVWVRGAQVVSATRLGAEPGTRELAGRWPSDHAGVQAVVRFGSPEVQP